MKKIITLIFALSILSTFSINYVYANSNNSNDPKSDNFQLVPCDGVKKYMLDSNGDIIKQDGKPVLDQNSVECDYNQFMELFRRIISYLLYLSIPLILFMIMWIGFKYVTSNGDPGRLADTKKMIMPLLLGLFWVLASWLVVRFVLDGLLRDRVPFYGGQESKETFIDRFLSN